MNPIKKLTRLFENLTDDTAMLTPEQKIQKAIGILNQNQVAEHLSLLLNTYLLDFEQYTFGSKPPENSNYEKLDKYLICRFGGKSLELIVVNLRTFFDDPCGDLCVKYNGQTVFAHNITKACPVGYGTRYGLHVSEILEFTFKNGPWMADLSTLVADIEENDRQRKLKESADKIRSHASKIDLG